MLERSIDSQVRSDIANEAVRHYGELSEDFPQKIRKRIKRKFRTDVDVPTILQLTSHFKAIYGFGASILKEFIAPAVGGYASYADVDIDKFTSALIRQYPNEDKKI